MTALEALHLTPPLAAALARLGWHAEDALVREVVPTAARGHNLVLVLPPSPVSATPALAGLLARLTDGRRGLLLAAEAQLEEWGRVAHQAAGDSPVRIQVAHGTARASRRLRDGAVDLLITTPATALALQSRSVLGADELAAVLLAWPEGWESDDAVAAIMQEAKEAQRVVLTDDSGRAESLVERYARRALTVGRSGVETSLTRTVRVVTVPWARRTDAIADLIELLDPATVVVWTADTGSHPAIAAAMALAEPEGRVVSGDAPAAQTIIAFDLPTADRLTQLAVAGDVVLLAPPGTERYVERIAPSRRTLRLPGAYDAATTAAASRRAEIVRTLESGGSHGALLALAPLFERHDPAAVAAAVYDLWTGSAAPAAPAAAPVAAAGPGDASTVRVFVGVGKKDGATVNDLVAILTKDVRVDRTKIGRVELRDAFALVELPAQDAERVAAALNGTTIRRRRVTARVDRGAPGHGTLGRGPSPRRPGSGAR